MNNQLLKYVPLNEFERICNLPCHQFSREKFFSLLARINVLYMIMNAGSGHIGSSLSSLDIVSYLYLNELRKNDPYKDVYFSSKGHDAPGLYAVLTGLNLIPFESIHKLRRLDGLPGHPDISIPEIEANTGSLGMGISKAKGMAVANRLMNKEGNIFVLTGDGELQEGQIWESLVSAANQKLSELIVIVDHNKLQSDTLLQKVNDLGDLEFKFKSFGWHTQRCDGHNYEALANAISEAKKNVFPSVIIADTVKSKGISFMESTSVMSQQEFYPYHSGAPSFDEYQKAIEELENYINHELKNIEESSIVLTEININKEISKNDNKVRLIQAYSDALCSAGEAIKDLVVLDGDLMIDCGLLEFRNRFPERFFECGIAEQDMVSQAGGMALKGLLPVVHSFSCFLTTRANEQIFNNATENKKIIYVGSLSGILPAAPGHSHQSVRDIAILSSVPGLYLFEPCCEEELFMGFRYLTCNLDSSAYLRLVSIPYERVFELPKDYQIDLGVGVSLTQGNDAVLISYGLVMLSEAVKVANILSEEYAVGVKVINLPWLNYVDEAWLVSELNDFKFIFTLDNHLLKGGQGEMIAALVARSESLCDKKVKSFAINGVPVCGRNEEVLEYYQLDADHLSKNIMNTLQCRVPI